MQIVSGVFVGAYVARYLGPSQLGVMSLILTIGVIVGPLLDLGTRAILIKKFSQEKNNLNQIFWTIFWVKLVLSCCITTALFVTIQSGLIGGLAGEAGLLIAFGLGIILLYPFTQFQCVIIAAVKNKALMIGQIICLCFTALFRAGCVYYELSLEWFVGVNFLVALLSHVNVLLTSAYYKLIPRLAGFKFEALKILLRESWPLILSGFAVILYMRIDIVMIDFFLSEKDIGHYWVANRLLEILYFFPLAIAKTLSSKIYQKLNASNIEDQKTVMCSVFGLVGSSSLILCVLAGLGGVFCIPLLYGVDYSPSVSVFCLSVLALPAVSLGVMRNFYLIHQEQSKLSMYATFLGLFTNVGLNIILIPTLGILGAALATVFSQYVSCVISTRLLMETWLFKAQISSIFRNPKLSFQRLSQ